LRLIAALALAFLVLLVPARADTSVAVDTILGEWTDTARDNRVVPYKAFLPVNAAAARPVVLWSHGLGGNRDGAEYLLRFLAENGYVAVAVQHPGSDTPAVLGELGEGGFSGADRNELRSKIKDSISPRAAINRFRDIPFAIDQLALMNQSDAKLRGRLDMNRIGMSGHSFGAITTMMLAGQTPSLGRMTFGDPRVKAAIAYSPSLPRRGSPETAFASIKIPTFHMTGTKDQTPFDNGRPPESRQEPYRNIHGPDKYLIVFQDGDHMIFSGRVPRTGLRPHDDAFHALINKASLAFWEAYLMGNNDAKAYLTDGRFKQDLGTEGAYEFEAH